MRRTASCSSSRATRNWPTRPQLPELPFYGDRRYKTRVLDRDIACHYSFMHENLMDMNHQFLHRSLMGRIRAKLLDVREGEDWLEADYSFARTDGKQSLGERLIIGSSNDDKYADLMTIRTGYPYQTLRYWTDGKRDEPPALDLWNAYVPTDRGPAPQPHLRPDHGPEAAGPRRDPPALAGHHPVHRGHLRPGPHIVEAEQRAYEAAGRRPEQRGLPDHPVPQGPARPPRGAAGDDGVLTSADERAPHGRMNRDQITAEVAARLVAEQFPQWAELPVHAGGLNGWDNTTFRLGDELSIRLPSGAGYATAVDKEQRWLPLLAPQLPLPIPVPVAVGRPGRDYPWQWSIYRWLDGSPSSVGRIADPNAFAVDLAGFLTALYAIDAVDGPPAGPHSAHRGGPLGHFDDEEIPAALDLLADDTRHRRRG